MKLALTSLLLVTLANAADPLRIETTLVDPEATHFGTYQSYNQKVVRNRRGIFMTHLRTRNEKYTAQQWRLSWSQDGGRTFTTLFEATDATNPPVLETDAADNLYLARPDFVDLNVHLYRFLSAEDYRAPHRTAVPNVAAGKFSMVLDETRGQLCYFSHNGAFLRWRLDGTLIGSTTLTRKGPAAYVQYPLMNLDASGTLHGAWTTLHLRLQRYWSIHHAQSADGGISWTTFTGASLPLPIIDDESGPSDRITLDDEFEPSTWLSSMLVKDGKAHFLYLARTTPPRQHHVRFDIATGKREVDHQDDSLKGDTLAMRSLDGFLVTRPRQTGGPLYCISSDVSAKRLVCLISRDNGGTWHDYAVSADFHQPYAIGGCREITPDGHIIGSFTELDDIKKIGGENVWFFKIKAE